MANEYATLSRILKELEAVVERETHRHLMDSHLCSHHLSILEDEVINGLEAIVDYTPSDDELTGEPPLTASEMHEAAWKQRQALHS